MSSTARPLFRNVSGAALRTFSAEQLLVLLRVHGDDIAVAAERWLLEALVSWAAAQDNRRQHSAGLGPQRSVSSGGEVPGSPSRWRSHADSPQGSQDGGSVRGGSLWRDGSGEPSSASLRAAETGAEQPENEAVSSVGMSRAAHVGAVAAPLLEYVRWDLLPDAPTGVTLLPLLAGLFSVRATWGITAK